MLKGDGGLYITGPTAVSLDAQEAELVIDDALVKVNGSSFGISGYYFQYGTDKANIYGMLSITGVSKVFVYAPNACIINLLYFFLSDHNVILSPRDVRFRWEVDWGFPLWSGLCVNGKLVKDKTIEITYYNPADVNIDGDVNISDVVAEINTMAGDETFKNTADVNSDGERNISDVVAIINVMAGGEVPLPSRDAASEAGYCPNANHPHVIDMGDAGKWSCCNVDASAPWEIGGYYAWGETEEKSTYTWETYQHCDGSQETVRSIGNNIAGTQYDVAHVKWQDCWVMPSQLRLQVLISKCTVENFTLNDVPGKKITASDGTSIFIPATGYRTNNLISGIEDGNGYYWASTIYGNQSFAASTLTLGTFYANTDFPNSVYSGQPVRAFYNDQPESETDAATEAGLCPDTNHPHVIDLGDAGKWACCNVGASAPWEAGGHYAWGETEEKSTCSWSNYIHCDGTQATCKSIGENIAGTVYDVAHMHPGWGGNWQMPTSDQMQLLKNYSKQQMKVNNMLGTIFTASNGKSIFLPNAGLCYDTGLISSGSYYWTSNCDGTSSKAFLLLEHNTILSDQRYFGFSVRPVSK